MLCVVMMCCSSLVNDPLCMRTSMSFSFPHLIKQWLDIKQNTREVPKIFMVNWYQEDKNGKTIWPGFGENIRLLEWIFKSYKIIQKFLACVQVLQERYALDNDHEKL
ncbi:hypothetical protein Y032_0281g1263 [Ancylostoma ceylanicum]|uniref:Phosphoenolpyruvate carboxykinase C-terminal P-loop domain-containing protein n=1 Tax=Ancylostoma ceylanicum TaxID=53326 RepID=A0A016S7V3_9BILA|nr:hypothetical protein Y032_0281g1263 [Ancylostoma ceylanicum]